MQLHVKVRTNVYGGFELEESVNSVDDAESIGTRVGRAVRNWIREVPITNSGRRLRLEVDARWANGTKAEPEVMADAVEDQPPKPRRRKKRK